MWWIFYYSNLSCTPSFYNGSIKADSESDETDLNNGGSGDKMQF